MLSYVFLRQVPFLDQARDQGFEEGCVGGHYDTISNDCKSLPGPDAKGH